MDKKVDFELYLITDRRLAAGSGGLKRAVEEALKAGVRAVQLREKDLDARELLELATELRGLTRAYGAKLFINDRVDVALLSGADGIHLPESSFSPSLLREKLSGRLLIGVSCHSVEAVKRAKQEGADFVTLGPVYDTPSKRAFGSPIGLDPLKEASGLGIPVFALGGIKKEDIGRVMGCGVYGIACISAIMAAEDIRGETEQILKEIRKNKKEVGLL